VFAGVGRQSEYSIQAESVEFSTLVQFSKLVSDSPTSEVIHSLLAQTVVEKCGVFHALVFGTADTGEFALLRSFGGCGEEKIRRLDLSGVGSMGELRAAIIKGCGDAGYKFRSLPLISDAGLFGALVVLYSDSKPFEQARWPLIEGLTELTAISLSKAHQHQKLQKAYDDLRLSQEALVRTEKIRALGQMSAGVAHDLKNLLNPLLLYTDLMRDSAGDREEVLEITKSIDRILVRGVETVERLRDFSRQSSEEAQAVLTDLNAMVQEAVEITKPRLSPNQVTLELGAPPQVLIRPADCVTAIVNLLFNAVDAVEGKGAITVRTGGSEREAWIQVEDNGPGISPEVMSRILEPFFTTKGNLGTGLGVPIVYAFTQRHGGRLDIESEPGRGARFTMRFPVTTSNP
jgi:signal transduction histidine kinase